VVYTADVTHITSGIYTKPFSNSFFYLTVLTVWLIHTFVFVVIIAPVKSIT
jgi:hypothetical protein